MSGLFREFALGQTAARFGGIPIQTSSLMPDGKVVVVQPGASWTRTLMVGVHPEMSPTVIARKVVRREMADVLAWLGSNAPSMVTGQEILDRMRAGISP